MALRIEKTVFISYRRTDVYIALAVYENLKSQGYDVFFDYISISSGDFEQVIISNIRARAHFLLILTPTALDRCNEPGDWLRREIEVAIDEKRNIIPLFFKGFRFGDPSASEKLTGKLKDLPRYNGLNVHEDYFDEGIDRLRTQYLNTPLETVLHPVSNEVEKLVRKEQVAADRALEHIDDVRGLVKKPAIKTEVDQLEGQAIQYELRGDIWNALQAYYIIRRRDPLHPRVDVKIKELEGKHRYKPGLIPNSDSRRTISLRFVGFAVGGLLVLALLVWGASRNLWNFTAVTSESNPIFTAQTSSPINQPEQTMVSILPQTPVSTTPYAVDDSKMVSNKDGMTLLYVPAGEFTMGSDSGETDEKPVHTVNVNAYWIDETEVTNERFSKCVSDGVCGQPTDTIYYGDPNFANHPVVYVTWSQANAYCSWANRRLPTEAEWEKAASWNNVTEEKYIYPWGNVFKCMNGNFDDETLLDTQVVTGGENCDGFSRTSPVGRFPNGQSPCGALDMAGNVWEWVSSLYKVYPYNISDGREDLASMGDRVARGSAWYGIDPVIHSTNRFSNSPATSVDSIGFRCAMDATP